MGLLDSVGGIQGGQGQPQDTQKTGGGFFNRLKEISLFSADEKVQKQETLNFALKNRNSIFE